MKEKKSDSLNSLPESEDSGLDLKIVANLDSKGHESGNVYHPMGICPTLRAGMGGLSNRSQLILNVSGPTKSTNMPVKSTENGLETESSLKAISGKSQAQVYPTMTFSALASLVRLFPLRENVKVFKTSQGELFSLKSSESLEIKDQRTYSLRMLKDYFLTTMDEPSQLYCFHWMNLGMMRNGLSQTLSITYRKTGKGSLSSVLEKKVDEKYYLTEKSWQRFLKRDMGKITDGKKDASGCLSLKNQSGQAQWDGGTTLIHNRYGGFGEKEPRIFKNESPTIRTPKGGGHLPDVVENQRIRRLTPKECERLQGFPDGWTEGVSDTQRYKMMGNAVSVPVIKAIGKKILEVIKEAAK